VAGTNNNGIIIFHTGSPLVSICPVTLLSS
jgi:hypothetical protein